MKYLVFLLFFSVYTEGVLLAQQPTILENDLTIDSVNYENQENQVEEGTDVEDRPRISPYATAQEKYNSEAIQRRDIDADKWRKATAGIDYSADKEEKRKRKKGDNTDYSPLAGAFLLFLKWFFIIGGIALVAFLIFRFVGEGNIFSGKSRKIGVTSEEIDLNNIEENLETVELDPIIKKAVAAKNFPLAIRLYYLAILKELTLSGAITWKKDKTNRIYVQEMQPHPLMEKFRQVTAIFERVWYGDTPLDESGFTTIQPSFQNLLTETRRGKN
jgi:Domain of unknown function (DUF4129)